MKRLESEIPTFEFVTTDCTQCEFDNKITCPDCQGWTSAERKNDTCKTCNNKLRIVCTSCKGRGTHTVWQEVYKK